MNCKDFDFFRELVKLGTRCFTWDISDFNWFKDNFKRIKNIKITYAR